MFGYIRTDEPYLYKKDETLYNSVYCGVCKAIGKSCGQKARLSLNYDITFLAIIIHNILGEDITIKKQRCIAHWIKSRPIAQNNKQLNLMADINVLLAYYKCQDDVIDNNKGKFKRAILKKGYKKAIKRNLEIANLIDQMYKDLRKLEETNCSSIDMVCEPFSVMMQNISKIVLKDKATQYTDKLFYNLGKWIYLIDALDDFNKDIKNNNFNVFISNFGKDYNYKDFKNNQEINLVLSFIFAEIKNAFNNIKFNFNTDLICNILFRGIPKKTNLVLNKELKIGK